MSEMTDKLLGFLNEKYGRFNWRGWRLRRYNSQFFRLEKSDNEWCMVGVMTITPKLFLRISLKLWHEVPYGDFQHQFDPTKDFHWYEFKVTDELMTSGKKSVCSLMVKKGEKYYDVLDGLFKQMQAKAIFHDAVKNVDHNKKMMKEIVKEFQ